MCVDVILGRLLRRCVHYGLPNSSAAKRFQQCAPPKKVGTTHTHKSAIDKIIINAKDIEKKEKKYVTPICSTATKLKI